MVSIAVSDTIKHGEPVKIERYQWLALQCLILISMVNLLRLNDISVIFLVNETIRYFRSCLAVNTCLPIIKMQH